MKLLRLTQHFTLMGFLLSLLSNQVLADQAPKGLKASKFVVAEKIVLKDGTGKDIILKPGMLQLESLNGGVVLSPLDLLSAGLLNTLDNEVLDRGGDGEPPRGPVGITFRNDVNSNRGILDMNFSGARHATFWLDKTVDTNEDNEPLVPGSIRSNHKTSGQGIGLRFSVTQRPGQTPLTLLLLENERSPIADIELMRAGGDHGDPR